METTYVPDPKRYDGALFRRCGRSGIGLPPVSLGLWQNFGGVDPFENGHAMVRRAFDRGVTHFDLANNYGPPYGSAEENFGRYLRKDLGPHRRELIISTKATTQAEAFQLAMATVLPSIFLSGYIFQIETMPPIFAAISRIIPTTYYIRILRGIILRGAGFHDLWFNALILLVMGCVSILAAAALFVRQRRG